MSIKLETCYGAPQCGVDVFTFDNISLSDLKNWAEDNYPNGWYALVDDINDGYAIVRTIDE